MNTEKMSVHQALCELKILGDRIYKAQHSVPFVVAEKQSTDMINGIPVPKYMEQMKSAYQQTQDLIRRANAIKQSVVISNATTYVQIGDNKYTVAEAIYMKTTGIKYYSDLLAELSNQYTNAQQLIARKNGNILEDRADSYIKSIYGESASQNAADDIAEARKRFIEAQSHKIFDPMNIDSEIKRLEKFVSDFIVNVDSALSVSNAVTEIEVSY